MKKGSKKSASSSSSTKLFEEEYGQKQNMFGQHMSCNNNREYDCEEG